MKGAKINRMRLQETVSLAPAFDCDNANDRSFASVSPEMVIPGPTITCSFSCPAILLSLCQIPGKHHRG